jgi:hypothetical protein
LLNISEHLEHEINNKSANHKITNQTEQINDQEAIISPKRVRVDDIVPSQIYILNIDNTVKLL